MSRIRINLSVDEKVYKDFQEYCRERGMIPSRKVELYIKKELEEAKK